MVDETTTREGVENEEIQHEEEAKDLRQSVMDDIYRKRKEEMVQVDDEEEPEPNEDPEPKSAMRKIKVYGEEREVPEDEIIEAGIRAYQKETAADERLREAAERQRMLEQKEAELRELEQQLQGRNEEPAREPAREPAKESAQDDDDFIDTIVDRLYGGEDEARQAVKDLIARAQHREDRNFSEQEIAALVQKEVDRRETATRQEQTVREIEQANAWFSDNYGWVESDPKLNAFAESQVRRLRSEHPHYGPQELVEAVGKEVESFVSTFKGHSSNQSLDSKREAKRRTDNPPAAKGRMPSPPESKPKTKRDTFAEIAKARGQSVI